MSRASDQGSGASETAHRARGQGGGTGLLGPGLYMVSTPIGAARDITLRALDVLAAADVLAAEDTRTLRHLMDIHGISLGGRTVVAYHDHNGAQARPKLLQALAEGKSVAYASEAGTPLVADPGFDLTRAAASAGHPIFAVPGASAVLAALTVAGLPTDRFLFAGFPPATSAARKTWITGLRDIPATLVLYESPRRLATTLAELGGILGDRPAAVCRELTKRFEEVTRLPLSQLAARYAEGDTRGEVVIVIDRPDPETSAGEGEIEEALRKARLSLSLKDAAQVVADATGRPRREVYQLALRMESEG